jgi:membrane protein
MIGSLKRVFSLIQQSFNKYSRDDGLWLAGAMAYYAAFSLFPLVLVLVSILGFLLRLWPAAQDAQHEAIALVALNASPALAVLLDQVLSAVQAQAGVSGPFGLIVLLIGAGGIFAALDGAFDRLWNVSAPTSGGLLAALRLILFQRLAGFLMLLALGGLVVAAFAGGLVISAVGAYADQLPLGRPGWQLAQALLSMGLDTLVFAVIYKVLPKPYVRWQDALAGALFSAIVWEIGRLVLAAVLAGQTFSAYGVVGAFIALMAWIYYACTIFFIGAELVQVWCQSEKDVS